MNAELKLLKLLQVAVENGWKSPLTASFEKCKIRAMKSTPLAYEVDPFESDEMWIFVHLNDIVTNWEEGQVSFIEALCKNTYSYQITDKIDKGVFIQEFIKNKAQLVKIGWTLQPTNKRLDWLFETFNHLIHE